MNEVLVGVFNGKLYCLGCNDTLKQEDLDDPFFREGELVCKACRMAYEGVK